MKKFYLVENTEKEGASQLAETVCGLLLKKGASCVCCKGYLDKSILKEDTDCIITIGGDGTLIKAAIDTAGLHIPLMGINRGHLGYLTGIGGDSDIEPMLDKLLEGRYSIEKRMMLEGQAVNNGARSKSQIALNEVVISRILNGKPIHTRIFVNGEFLNEYSSDGIIISTPTGSTAYNLSAGGPLVEPSARMMIITPICPHTLSLRSIVLSAKSVVEIAITGEEYVERAAFFDGVNTLQLRIGDVVRIKESRLSTSLIKLSGDSFLDNIRNKMSGI